MIAAERTILGEFINASAKVKCASCRGGKTRNLNGVVQVEGVARCFLCIGSCLQLVPVPSATAEAHLLPDRRTERAIRVARSGGSCFGAG